MWIKSLKEYKGEKVEEGLSLISIMANLSLLEWMEIKIRARYIMDIEEEEDLITLVRALKEDSEHLLNLKEASKELGSIAWISPGLYYTFKKILERKEAYLLELLHVTLLEPTISSITSFLYEKKNFLKRIKEEEDLHVKEISKLFKGAKEEDFLNFLEENSIVLFTTALTEEEGKTFLSFLIGDLKPFYSKIDEKRIEAVREIFGKDSKIIDFIKNYGLSKRGLC
ncbi:hypothetical protein HRbin06_00733 [archaeon HR06]|nr:hypothetical protein HRbin06_00733 [archaeon HR06]